MGIEQDAAVGQSEVAQAMQANDPKALDDLHSIEAVLYIVKELEEQIANLKELKKKRTKAIDRQMDKSLEKIEFLKSMIFETLDKHKEKQVRFPGVGLVSARKPKTKYEVSNHEELIKYLKKHDPNSHDDIISWSREAQVNKHELNKVIAKWDKQGSLPSFVKKDDGSDKKGVTIRFDTESDDVNEDYADMADEVQDLDFS
tara:strand:- start:2216 stop:2818 length:603 start_codon:yes stop_codon:yes gene_type:complete